MTEKEMIEEMAKVIDDRLIEANNYLGSMNKGTGYWIAQKLVEHYQPKIPEDSVVLSKEEYQELEELRLNHAKDLINANKLYEERIADLKIEFSNHIKNLERKIDRRDRDLNSQADRLINLKEELSQARKETAKEIIETILEESGIDILENYYKLPTRIFNKIKSKFGVEVEE